MFHSILSPLSSLLGSHPYPPSPSPTGQQRYSCDFSSSSIWRASSLFSSDLRSRSSSIERCSSGSQTSQSSRQPWTLGVLLLALATDRLDGQAILTDRRDHLRHDRNLPARLNRVEKPTRRR